jgi:hypothetical protein
MRIYSAASEETLRARKFLKEWAGDRFVSKEQYELLEKENVSELRTTNIFLRLVLFFFTVIVVGAGTALFFQVFFSPSVKASGVLAMIFAAVCYAGAELAGSKARLYRYGIEEALAVLSIGYLCIGLDEALFMGRPYSSAEFVVPAVGAVFSLWIWRRFGFSYAFLAAMILVVFVPGYWTSSHEAQRLMVAGFYAIGLGVVVAVRSRHRFDYLDEAYSLAEAMLWLGIYLATNLKILALDFPAQRWIGGWDDSALFARPFYWTTWVLIWCLPVIVLVRGVRKKDRFVIAVGGIMAVLTMVCNKPYLGWVRHTWDPMILGVLLTGIAIFLRRWLATGPNRIRHGFTAARLSGKDKQWMNVGSIVLGQLSPQSITPSAQPSSSDFRFGGGQTGGGGAGGEF